MYAIRSVGVNQHPNLIPLSLTLTALRVKLRQARATGSRESFDATYDVVSHRVLLPQVTPIGQRTA